MRDRRRIKDEGQSPVSQGDGRKQLLKIKRRPTASVLPSSFRANTAGMDNSRAMCVCLCGYICVCVYTVCVCVCV